MTDQTQTRMTRREALKGGSAAAVAAGAYLMQEQLVQAASAQTNEPRIQLGQDYVIDDDPGGNGDLVIEHLPSGAEFRYDSSVDAWVPTGQIGDGTTSANHGSVTTVELAIDGHTSVKGVETGTATMNNAGAATDDTWDTLNEVTTQVSFSSNFDSDPVVIITNNQEDGHFSIREGVNQVADVDTAGFQWRHSHYTDDDRSTNTIAIDWLAIEQ